jgi:hypothetical protein
MFALCRNCRNRTRDLLCSRRVFPPPRHIGRQNVRHHVVIKIRELFLQPAACLTSTLLETGVATSAYYCPHCWDTGLPYGLHIRRKGHNPPRGPSAGWWVLTTANAAGPNGLTCLRKHGEARDNKFLVTSLLINVAKVPRSHAEGHRAPRNMLKLNKIFWIKRISITASSYL